MTQLNTEDLIGRLTAELTPVRRLRPPVLRALVFLAAVTVLSGWLIAHYANLDIFILRTSQPRVALDCAATLLTGIVAIVAAFYLSVPGRSPYWAWAPIPPFVLWLATSGLGCLQNGLSLHGTDGFVGESSHCFVFIVGASVPLAAGLFWLLRRARPIAPRPVAFTGALGVAALAAFLLQFFHPFDVTVIDLTLHLSAVGLVMALATLLRRPLLAAR